MHLHHVLAVLEGGETRDSATATPATGSATPYLTIWWSRLGTVARPMHATKTASRNLRYSAAATGN
jgi:hypothetical protein